MAKIIAQGAEAILKKEKDTIIKERISKSYRHKDIDLRLRKHRTRREAKILRKLEELDFPAPKVLDSDDKDMIIEMEFLRGDLVKDILDKKPELSKEIGRLLAILHNNDIIHADLTTSNMILKDNKVCFIDFGLSFISLKDEDKAVDLHLLSRAMESKHHMIFPGCFNLALEAYSKEYKEPNKILKRLVKVEKRGRYKQKAR